MKIIKLSILFLFGFAHYNLTLADEAPVIVTPSGSVKPINNNDIKMVRETIDIFLFAHNYRIEVNYEFLNTGNTQNVTMGFPKGNFQNFEAYVNGNKQSIVNRKGEWRYNFNGFQISAMESYGGSSGPAPIQSFECFDTEFKTGETKTVKNTYNQSYSDSYSGSRSGAFYILSTGALWKDDIDEIIIRVHSENIPKWFSDSFYFNNEETQYSHSNSFIKKYSNIEPEDDISFAFNMNLYPITNGAQSTLAPSNKFTYDSKNLQDEDINTAWVEGMEGYGEDMSIYFNSTYDCRGEDDDIFSIEISAIHIINGYAKSESAFRNNSRVKELEVKDKLVVLEDSPKEQVLKFDPPLQVFCGELNLKIKSVYKGEKWADTALTEVWFDIVGQ